MGQCHNFSGSGGVHMEPLASSLTNNRNTFFFNTSSVATRNQAGPQGLSPDTFKLARLQSKSDISERRCVTLAAMQNGSHANCVKSTASYFKWGTKWMPTNGFVWPNRMLCEIYMYISNPSRYSARYSEARTWNCEKQNLFVWLRSDNLTLIMLPLIQ